MILRGKRELLAKGIYWSGAAAVLSRLPRRDCLLVLNYHRVGDAEADLFDPGVFSATAEELDSQIAFVKKHASLVTLEEALEFAEGRGGNGKPRYRALITFDDGYLDNYQIAFPILRSHGVQGVFFLASGLVGSCEIPWWDLIAYLMKTARRRRFTLRYPVEVSVDLDERGAAAALQPVLNAYRTPGIDAAAFFQALKEAAGSDDPPGTLRRFLDWDEAREMLAGGMAIGSHTHSHEVLGLQTVERQRWELEQSKAILSERLQTRVETLAYPVGLRSCFTSETADLARQAGYRAAFSFYGGVNRAGAPAFELMRVAVGGQSPELFRVRTAMCAAAGKYWP